MVDAVTSWTHVNSAASVQLEAQKTFLQWLGLFCQKLLPTNGTECFQDKQAKLTCGTAT